MINYWASSYLIIVGREITGVFPPPVCFFVVTRNLLIKVTREMYCTSCVPVSVAQLAIGMLGVTIQA